MDRCVRITALTLCAVLIFAVDAAPQGAASIVTRSAGVTAIAEPIEVDGVLDEAAWKSAAKIGELVQRQPATGQAPSERTEVVLLRDENHLYVGVYAYDAEPDRVIGTQMMRDGSLAADDRIELLLDTFRDQRSAFYFATNPAGALVDGLAFANGQLNTDWDAIWQVRTSRTTDGWVAEFAIPFKSLSFPAGQDVWGFNVARSIYRKLEDDRWSGARLDTQFLQVSEAGEITNLDGLTQGIGLDLRPFLAGRWLSVSGREDDFTGKPGLDLFYSITPSLRLTATFNTDFGETEVDARQINLTRFSLLFPEKRAFFLEGAGVFSFAEHGPGNARRHSRHRSGCLSVLQPANRVDRRTGSTPRCRRQADGHRGKNRGGRVRGPDAAAGNGRWRDDRRRRAVFRRPRAAEFLRAVICGRHLHERASRSGRVG